MQKPFLVLLALLTAVIMVGCTPSSPSATPSALPKVSGGDAENTVTPDPVLTPEPGFSPAAGTSLFDFSALSVSFFDLSAYGFAAPEYSVTDNTLVLNISGEASYGVINMQLSAGDSIKNAMSLASDSGYMRIRIENTGESDANIAVLLVTAKKKRYIPTIPPMSMPQTKPGKLISAFLRASAALYIIPLPVRCRGGRGRLRTASLPM